MTLKIVCLIFDIFDVLKTLVNIVCVVLTNDTHV